MWYPLYFIILLVHFIKNINCFTHWKVTEEGRIELDSNSIYTLLRPYDLASFLKQSERLQRLDFLKQIIASKNIPSSQKDTTDPISVSSFQEHFYKTDLDCLKAEQQLTKFSFYETHLTSWHNQGFYLPKESLDIKRSTVKLFKKPFCDIISLPFNLNTFDHLDSIQSKENITMLPEADLLKNILIEPEDFYGHTIHVALLTNSSSWVYLSMAADYFRIKGDYFNAVKCFQRSIYYAPRHHKSVPMLSLSNMLHKLHFLNDSLSIALSGYSIDSNSSLFAYYIGNIYVTLGDLKLADEWYDQSTKLDDKFRQAFLKKHAVMCHNRLEKHLELQHSNLKKKLDDLKDFQIYSDEWFQLNSKIELERSSQSRKETTRNNFENMLLNSKSRICQENNKKIECQDLAIHFLYFAFGNSTIINSIIHNNNCSNEKICSSKKRVGKLCLMNQLLNKQESDSKNSAESLLNRIQTEKNFNIKFKPPTSRDFVLSDLK
ncbi:tetratricopeptide repeat 17-like [Brachionus plicatilis]|uniref:Tetratricopeptide repeat 17-like n=1 Tax=Brachionus plicatilis TaxID=10195 RepID=A0A3M7PUT4_BRAPC|nr:tetratricopeptide repeat 17-like [Brachionus plicatilis]